MTPSLVLPTTLAATILCIATVSAFQGVPPGGHSLGSVTGGNFKKADIIMEKKCIACHNDKVIREAIAACKDMKKIQQRMEQKGVALSADDRQVLGVFWEQTPLKPKK